VAVDQVVAAKPEHLVRRAGAAQQVLAVDGRTGGHVVVIGIGDVVAVGVGLLDEVTPNDARGWGRFCRRCVGQIDLRATTSPVLHRDRVVGSGLPDHQIDIAIGIFDQHVGVMNAARLAFPAIVACLLATRKCDAVDHDDAKVVLVINDIVAEGAREEVLIAARTAIQQIVAVAAVHDVSALAANEQVFAAACNQHIVAVSAIQAIVARATVKGIGACIAFQMIVAVQAAKHVVTGPAEQGIVKASANQRISLAGAKGYVVTKIAQQCTSD
jgi:hypothetical protein